MNTYKHPMFPIGVDGVPLVAVADVWYFVDTAESSYLY